MSNKQNNQCVIQDSWSFHFWNGIKFGYPICCIIWFCNAQTNFGEQQHSLFEKVYREAYDEYPPTQASKDDYSMCPECQLTKRRNG